MTDLDLLLKKLAFVESCVSDVQRLANVSLVASDVKERRFLAYTLQVAAQGTLDIASHVVSSERLGEPTTNRALFDTLARAGWIPNELASTMRDIAGFRNVVVHGYQEVDPAVLVDIAEHRLDDLLAYCRSVRDRLARDA